MYKVKYSKQSIRTLRKIQRNWADRIISKIESLAKNPFENAQSKSLKGLNAYRLRVGDWRIVYQICDDLLEIWVVKVTIRGEVYK